LFLDQSILDENLSEAEGASWTAFKVVTTNILSLQARKLQAICCKTSQSLESPLFSHLIFFPSDVGAV
jgi:hypothetical protein